MRVLINKKIIKQVLLAIVIIMLCNFTIPSYSYAVETEEGGSLMNWLGEFICFVPDAILEALQYYFVSLQGIKNEDGEYQILYSPATIFAGEVPAFDINFISPGDDKTVTRYKTAKRSLIESLDYNGAEKVTGKTFAKFIAWYTGKGRYIDGLKDTYGYKQENEIKIDELEGHLETYYADTLTWFGGSMNTFVNSKLVCAWCVEGEDYVYLITETETTDITHDPSSSTTIPVTMLEVALYKIGKLEDLESSTEIAGTTTTLVDATKTYKSSAGILQKVVATCYNALRKVAVVGLLSVLVYLGIRIVLSSTSAKDKSKYKAMLKDWLVALCILFTLHYLMNVIIIVVNNINEILGVSIIGENGEDILISTVRERIRIGDSWGEVLTYLVIYFVLMIYTVIFTIQYLRRVIYLAFLTMIAPLITLTYPLDKIKDKKAQAFDMWIKDYMFFSLLQVLHLLLYYVFLGSSLDLAKEGNWIFAIIAIGFMTKAEKITKKMFGFEKSNSMGALAAGATGALVMDLINKAPHGAPRKGGAEGRASSSANSSGKNVRIATEDPLASLRTVTTAPTGSATTGETGEISGSPGAQPRSSGGLPDAQTQGGSSFGARNTGTGTSTQSTGTNQRGTSTFPQTTIKPKKKSGNKPMPSSTMPTINKPKRNILNGVAAVGGRYLLPAAGTLAGGVLEGTGAMIGLAAGISQGNIVAALEGARVGARAGMNLGQTAANIIPNTVKSVKNTVNEIEDTFNKGAYGEEVANNIRFDREVINSSDYRNLKRASNLSDKEFDKKIKQMLDAGIKDPKKMKKILKNHKMDPKKYTLEKAIAYNELAEKCPEGILYNNSKFIRFCEDHDIKITEEQINELRRCIIDFK